MNVPQVLLSKVLRKLPFLLFPFILLSCHPGKKSPVPSPHETVILQLLTEADSLMRADSLFYYTDLLYSRPRLCFNDSAIEALQDSAIRLNPLRKKSYIARYAYLLRSRQFSQLLPFLRRMEEQADTLLSADLYSLKAMLEDRDQDSLAARRDFLKADSAYNAQIAAHAQDSLRYAASRFSKALNLSLMKNDFTPLREEIKLYGTVHHGLIHGLEVYGRFHNKEEYYRYLFEKDPSTPLRKLSLTEHRTLRDAVHRALEQSPHPAAARVRGIGYHDADGGVEIWIESTDDRSIADFRRQVFDRPYLHFLRIDSFKITEDNAPVQ